MHGQGVHVTQQGDRYKGTFRKGQRHGQGSLQVTFLKSRLLAKFPMENGRRADF